MEGEEEDEEDRDKFDLIHRKREMVKNYGKKMFRKVSIIIDNFATCGNDRERVTCVCVFSQFILWKYVVLRCCNAPSNTHPALEMYNLCVCVSLSLSLKAQENIATSSVVVFCTVCNF